MSHALWLEVKNKAHHRNGSTISGILTTARGFHTSLHLSGMYTSKHVTRGVIRECGTRCVRNLPERRKWHDTFLGKVTQYELGNTFVIINSMEMENRGLLNMHNGIPAP